MNGWALDGHWGGRWVGDCLSMIHERFQAGAWASNEAASCITKHTPQCHPSVSVALGGGGAIVPWGIGKHTKKTQPFGGKVRMQLGSKQGLNWGGRFEPETLRWFAAHTPGASIVVRRISACIGPRASARSAAIRRRSASVRRSPTKTFALCLNFEENQRLFEESGIQVEIESRQTRLMRRM